MTEPDNTTVLRAQIVSLMRMAADQKKAAREARQKRDELRLALDAQESEVSRLTHHARDLASGADGLREVVRAQIGAAVNPWFEEAELCFRPLSKLYGYRLIDVPSKGPSHEIEVIHVDGEKIASIVCVKPTPEMPVMFTVAGWRTGNGSPALPFNSMVDAAIAVGELTRWDPTGESQLQDRYTEDGHRLDALGNENREPAGQKTFSMWTQVSHDGNAMSGYSVDKLPEGPTRPYVVGTVLKPNEFITLHGEERVIVTTAGALPSIELVNTITVDPALEKLVPGTLRRELSKMARRVQESGQPGNRL